MLGADCARFRFLARAPLPAVRHNQRRRAITIQIGNHASSALVRGADRSAFISSPPFSLIVSPSSLIYSRADRLAAPSLSLSISNRFRRGGDGSVQRHLDLNLHLQRGSTDPSTRDRMHCRSSYWTLILGGLSILQGKEVGAHCTHYSYSRHFCWFRSFCQSNHSSIFWVFLEVGTTDFEGGTGVF